MMGLDQDDMLDICGPIVTASDFIEMSEGAQIVFI
jgi:peroxiredoxin family protein